MKLQTAILVLAFIAPAYSQTTSTAQPPDVVSSNAGNIRIERLATLEFPWGMALLPDGRLLITEKPGRLRIWNNGNLSEPIQGVPKVVFRGQEDQGGLLDVEIDPDFASNSLIYLSYSEAADPQPPDARQTREPRFGPNQDMTDTVGNRLLFAADGKLFITSGERMRFDPAQSLTSNLGKVVRINKDGSIPTDNPFVGRTDARGDIWSYGHRNMLSAALDPSSGRLWVVEMGPLGGDELNLIEKGKNYGWPVVSNGDNYDGSHIPDHQTKREFQLPVRSWNPVISPSGALFYTGTLFPAWRGNLIAGGLSSQSLVRFTLDGSRVAVEEWIDMKRRIRDLLQTPDGAILVIVDDQRGDLLRLTPAGASTSTRAQN
jgi:glucose/arabinose dehydrogenase